MNGEKVIQVSPENDWIFTNVMYENFDCELVHNCYFSNEIKTIVTKEQFESIEYRVE